MHGNGFFGSDGCCQLLIRCTAAAQGMAFDDLHPEHVSGATLQLRLEQKRKQVGCAASFCLCGGGACSEARHQLARR